MTTAQRERGSKPNNCHHRVKPERRSKIPLWSLIQSCVEGYRCAWAREHSVSRAFAIKDVGLIVSQAGDNDFCNGR